MGLCRLFRNFLSEGRSPLWERKSAIDRVAKEEEEENLANRVDRSEAL